VSAKRADRRRWLLVGAGGALAAIAVAMLAFVLIRPAPSPLDRAARLAGDAERFGSGRDAGDTLARISFLTEEDAEACVARHGPVPACDARFAAAGWARVAAARALGCTAPGRTELRRSAARHLAAVASLRPSPSAEAVPEPPPLPSCSTTTAEHTETVPQRRNRRDRGVVDVGSRR
jgi:hypothetical protein